MHRQFLDLGEAGKTYKIYYTALKMKYFSSTYFFYLSQRLFSAALVFLILIALANYIMIFFSCHGLHTYGAWLNKYHKVDLWLHRVLVRDFKLMFKIFHTVNTVHVLFLGLHFAKYVSLP